MTRNLSFWVNRERKSVNGAVARKRWFRHSSSMTTVPFNLSRQLLFLFFLLLPNGALTHALAQNAPATYAGKIGVDLDSLNDGNRAKPFIDLGKTLRGWTIIGGRDLAPVDEHGWPTADAATVLFDIRPFGTWAPPVDDPDNFRPDWSGTYKISFQGQATLGFVEETQYEVLNQKYDPASNTTTADLVVPKGAGLLCISFKDTKRSSDSSVGSGITHLRVIRPGYSLDTKAIFTDEYLNALKPFAVLRFMDWTATNYAPGFYGDPGHHVLNWADRHTLDDATQSTNHGTKYGAAWEYVAALATATGKDIWINIPVAATDDYVKNLAQLLKQQLPPTTNIYIEHSNEVWNFGFPQYTYNKFAAIDEVKQGGSNLNNDGETNQEVWAQRRHAKRLVEIDSIFRDTFGPSDAARIRPVYASWTISAKSHFENVMSWVDKTYGPPKSYFYALADAAYFGPDKPPRDADVPTLLQSMREKSDSNVKNRKAIQVVADQYGLKHFQYEVGPDVGGGKTENVGNRIESNRDPAMKDLILHDARDNWFAQGGDLYMYFDFCGTYNRFGSWGLSEDINNLNTPKWQAIYELTGTTPPK